MSSQQYIQNNNTYKVEREPSEDSDQPGHPLSLIKVFVVHKNIHKVRKRAKTRNRYKQVPHLTQDTKWRVTNSKLLLRIEYMARTGLVYRVVGL